jgi:hypothetical protein
VQRENDAPGDEGVTGEAEVVTGTAEVVAGAGDAAPIAVRDEPLPPVVPDPATLIRGFRLLAERIPGFRPLTAEESRAMVRASELGPEMIAAGLVAADVFDEAGVWLHMTPEELRALDTRIRDNDDAIDAARILLKGMEGANRVLKHRRGKGILALYAGLGIAVRSHSGRAVHLRPYYENMQRAYMKNGKRKKEKAPVTSPPPPDTGDGSSD